jgi:hypothetical protein
MKVKAATFAVIVVTAFVVATTASAAVAPGWLPKGYRLVGTSFGRGTQTIRYRNREGTLLLWRVTDLWTARSRRNVCGGDGANKTFRSYGRYTRANRFTNGRIFWAHGNHGDEAWMCYTFSPGTRHQHTIRVAAWTPHALGPRALARVVGSLEPAL